MRTRGMGCECVCQLNCVTVRYLCEHIGIVSDTCNYTHSEIQDLISALNQ